MKIVQLVTYSVFGGMSLHVLTLAKSLKQLGHDVEVLSMCDGPLIPEFRRAGIPVTVVPHLEQRMSRSPLTIARAIRYISKYIREKDVDVVHTHGPRAHFLGGSAARLSGRRVLVASVHGSFSQFTAGQDAELSPRKKRLKSLQYKSVDRLTARVADKLVAVCPATESELINQLGIPAASVRLVHNGIEDQVISQDEIRRLRTEVGFGSSDKVVAYVGRVAYHKGSHDLIDAMEIVAKKVPEARFLMVGEGPMMAEMMNRANQPLLNGKVFFTGVRKDAVALMAIADLVVLPSLSEGPSLTLVEAAMLGRAAVATRVGGMPEVVLEGQTGLLVSPHAPAELAAAITRLLTHDEERHAMAVTAREMWEKRPFSAPQMAITMEELYTELLAAKQA